MLLNITCVSICVSVYIFNENMRRLLLSCHSWYYNRTPKLKGYEFYPCLLPGIKCKTLMSKTPYASEKKILKNNNELTWNLPSCELITMVSKQAMQDNKREKQSEIRTAVMSMHSNSYQYWHSYPGVMNR